MTDVPPPVPKATPPGGPVSDRMQALLSRAVEEQVSEQRAVSLVLAELRGQVAGLAESLRLTASDAAVERLGGVVSHVVADLRTSTSLLGQRIEALSKRLETVASEATPPAEQAAARLTALAADVAAQRDAVERMRESVEQLASFPGALSALQRDVAGLHDRLQPLAELRSSVAELGATTGGGIEALRPRLDGLEAKIDQLAQVNHAERARDLVVDAVSSRLDRLEEAAARPVIGPEVLRGAFGDLRAGLDAASSERFEELAAGLGAVENRLGQVGQRVAEIGDAAGAVPALATDMGRIGSRLHELSGLREDLATVTEGIRALQAERPGEAMEAALQTVRQDLAKLSAQVEATPPPSSEDVATLVSQRVADRLVEALAPRIADVVLTRVSAALVSQLGEALSPRLKAETEQTVRQATSESERRILTHLDEAVLALAEALLRRRPGARAGLSTASKPVKKAARAEQPETAPAAAPAREPDPQPDREPASGGQDVQEIVDGLNTAGPDEEPREPEATGAPEATGRSAVTTGLVPAHASRPDAELTPPSVRAAKSVAKVAQARSVAARKAAPRKAPAGKATKPSSQPILDRTPDLPEDDADPVRSSPPQPRPLGRPAPTGQPASTGRPASAVRPAAGLPRPPLDRPIMPPAPRPQPPLPPEPAATRASDDQQGKRKPWWRPGG